MASNYLPLDEAARILGIQPDQLVEMRSQGQLRGFRDGSSWKFPQEEIDRLKEELGGEGSDIGVGSDFGNDIGLGSDPNMGSDISLGSDVALVTRQGDDGSDLAVVANSSESTQPPVTEPASSAPSLADDDDDELMLQEDGSDALNLGNEPTDGSTGPGIGSDLHNPNDSNVDVLSDIDLASISKGDGTGDLIRGDSDPDLALGSGVDDALDSDDDLVIADDDDDLVLAGGGSDISIAGDSGINLMSPSDSGLSLESEPLDLAGSSISALDLGGAGVDSPSSGGSGSLVDFQADEEFQLSPSSVGEPDDDSGSQVIEVEDSAAFVEEVDFGDDAAAVGVMEGEAFADSGMLEGDALVAEDGIEEDMGLQPSAGKGAPTMVAAYETPFSIWQVLALAGILLLMSLGGMLMTDLVRNLWAHTGETAPVSSLTNALISMFGFDS